MAVLTQLFEGYAKDLEGMGAVAIAMGFDVIQERPNLVMPRRDFGLNTFSASRAVLELSLRRRVQALPNVSLEHGRVVSHLLLDRGAVHGVSMRGGESREAALVIDASGRGQLTLAALDTLGVAPPRTSVIGVDVHYSSSIFQIPPGEAQPWKGVFTFPIAPASSRGALMCQIEGNRWICGLGGRGADAPPGDREGFLAFARSLRTPTVYQAIREAPMLEEPALFAFPESYRRHFEELASFPAGLLPLGDALCRFNPLYGQGMSVAALEGSQLRSLLQQDVNVTSLARSFFAAASEVIDTAWQLSAVPDFVFPSTTGERPANLDEMLRFNWALLRLAVEDPEVHRRVAEVNGLVRPRRALLEPELMNRVMALL
jgi:2-polyprenyl-6-methoxyphenol hydroxylase-like FAD-dependent oxidoreductase